jgi:hypothetical protein
MPHKRQVLQIKHRKEHSEQSPYPTGHINTQALRYPVAESRSTKRGDGKSRKAQKGRDGGETTSRGHALCG